MQFFKTGRKQQKGFTLIELLVVITILGILAAIITLAVFGLVSNANEKACQDEVKTVQTALDADIAGNNLASVSGSGTWVGGTSNDWAANPAGNPLFASSDKTFLRSATTQFEYQYDSTGKLSAIRKNTAPPAGITAPDVPAKCTV